MTSDSVLHFSREPNKNETNVRMVGPHGNDYDQDWDERWEVAAGPEPSRGVRSVQLPHVGPDHSDPARYCVLVTSRL